jgi:CCR4-NOT complex subunit CAF16
MATSSAPPPRTTKRDDLAHASNTNETTMAPVMLANGQEDTGSMVIRSLAYSYPGGKEILSDFSLELPPGSRCLLSGANGAGKTTLLQILAGKTMVSEDAVRVIGKPPFHDIALTCSGDLGYLGSQWRRNIGSAVRKIKTQRRFVFFGFLPPPL